MYTIDGWRVSIEETVAIEQIFRRTLGEDAVELYHDLLTEIRCLEYDLDQERKDFDQERKDFEGVNPLICDIRDIAEEVEGLLDSPRLTKNIKDKISRKVKTIKDMADENIGRW